MHDPFEGTWKLNPVKSQFDANHQPREGTKTEIFSRISYVSWFGSKSFRVCLRNPAAAACVTCSVTAAPSQPPSISGTTLGLARCSSSSSSARTPCAGGLPGRKPLACKRVSARRRSSFLFSWLFIASLLILFFRWPVAAVRMLSGCRGSAIFER